MDRFKETESSASTPGFRKAKKSTSNMGPPSQPRRNTSEDVVMSEPTHRVSSVGRPMPPTFSSNRIGHNTGRSSLGARQPGHTFPMMTKKTSRATKSVSPLLVATKSVNTPRVRFAQQKSTTTPRPSPLINVTHTQNATPSFPFPARKVSSSPLFRKQQPQQATTSLQSTPFSVKIARPLLPLWQQLDEQYQRSKHKRDVRRISSGHQSRQNLGQKIANSPRTKAYIAPKLNLRMDGEIDISSAEDEDDRERRQPAAIIPIKIAGGRQIAVKKSAARKIEFVDTTSDEGSENGSTIDNDSQEDQLLPEEYDLPQRGDGELVTPLRPSTISHSAPEITIELPQVKVEPEDDLPVGLGPPEELVNALEALTISPIRMQATRQLPFLRRNLRQGFIRRCADVLIPIHSDQKHVSLKVTYEYVDGIAFQAEIEEWICPLCNLFGKFTTQATLYCHLKWDHQEVYSSWEKIEESDVRQKWKLQVMIPQEVCDDGQVRHLHRQDEEDEDEEDEDEDDDEQEQEAEVPDKLMQESPSIPTSAFSSPFPSVSLSPLSPRQESQTEPTIRTSPDIPSPSKIKLSRESPPLPLSRSISTLQSSASRSRSMTGASQNTVTTTMTTTTMTTPIIPRETRYPTPPPLDNPLGPAARPPYLPAHSEYGGPTVYYSCRPGGACLFDLLGTLPMKEFGILEWEVLDREEEIYESDDVKEEYKVMQALWARWIMCHRSAFISNYYQGTLAFVDYYWQMIHRAAGWDALRYWLLILLANQFLNSHEVADVLTHYEELTGMAFWCNFS